MPQQSRSAAIVKAAATALSIVLVASLLVLGAAPNWMSSVRAQQGGTVSGYAVGQAGQAASHADALANQSAPPSLSADWTTLLSEGFEGAFPATGWQLAPSSGAYIWGQRNCEAHSGSYSALGHGGGTSGATAPCSSAYPANMSQTWLIYGPISLSGATAAEWTFWLKLNTPQDGDRFFYWVSTDGDHFSGSWINGTTSGWEQVTTDLSNVPGLGSVLGDSSVWIAFTVSSDASGTGTGAFVDDVLVRARGTSTEVLTYMPLALGQRVLEQASQAVSSDQSAVITTNSGVSVSVPQGAVSATASGSVGTMTFSIEESPSPVALPAGYTPVGSAYSFGPSGFNFSEPVKVTFPVPTSVDITKAGVMVYDEAAAAWVPAPSTRDATARTVSVETQHFTMFRLAQSAQSEADGQFYWSTSRGPGGSNVYGTWICVASATLDSGAPTTAYWWPQWTASVPMATDAPFAHSLPMGQYTFYYRWGGPSTTSSYYAETSAVTIGSTVPTHVYLTVPPNDSGAIKQGFPPCMGVPNYGLPDPSPGTGEVQITLNWGSEVDLDLHVTEPSGEEIYYKHKYSGTNGQLDLDNQCLDFVLGRPENVFWPAPGSGGAPAGHYLIRVAWYATCGSAVSEVPFSVRVIMQGRVYTFRKVFTGGPNTSSYMTVAQCDMHPASEGVTPICW